MSLFKKKLKIKTLAELIDKVANDEINVLYFQHNTISGINNKVYLLKELSNRTEREFELAKMLLLPHMRNFGQIFSLHITVQCWDCGETLKLMFVDDNTIALISEDRFWTYGQKTGKKDYFFYTLSKEEFYSEECQEYFKCGLVGKNITKKKTLCLLTIIHLPAIPEMASGIFRAHSRKLK